MWEAMALVMKLGGWYRQSGIEGLSHKTGVPWTSAVNDDPNAIADPVWPDPVGSAPPQYSSQPIADLTPYKQKGYQWSNNETGNLQLQVVVDGLKEIKSRLYSFETVNRGRSSPTGLCTLRRTSAPISDSTPTTTSTHPTIRHRTPASIPTTTP